MLVRVRVRVRVSVREAAVVLERGGHGVSNDVPTHRTAHQHHRTQLIVLDALRLHLQVEVVSAGVAVGGENGNRSRHPHPPGGT